MGIISITDPSMSFISAFNRRLETIVGIAGLRPAVRARLLRQQLVTVLEMTPFLATGSLIVSAMLVGIAWHTPWFAITIAWAVAVNGVYVATMLAWIRARYRADENRVQWAGPIRTLLRASLLGALWATPHFFFPDNVAFINAALVVGTGAMLCASMVAYANYPQALLGFTFCHALVLAAALMAANASFNVWVLAVLLPGFFGIMLAVVLRQGRNFIALSASETVIAENEQMIGLLLREFDETASDWLWGSNREGRIDRVSGGFMSATGLEREDLLGADFIHFLRCITEPGDAVMAELERLTAQCQTFHHIELRVTAAGEDSWWSLTGKPVFDETGAYAGYIGKGADVTERKRAERRITMLAHHDPLTGLINRTKFTEQLNNCVARLERYGTPFTIMFLDLDQFKLVNDSKGHLVGDKLLAQVAQRVKALTRHFDFAARLGGDEFAILLTDECDAERSAALATSLIAAVSEPFDFEEGTISVGISIGIAMAPINGTRPDQILRNADLALYRAKQDGRCVFRFFESQMDSEARERRLLENELHEAVRNGEMMLHYQPLVSATNGHPTGFEALIRWNHPIRGIVSPLEFIPIAERSNLIAEIGDWTIEQACMAAASWPQELTVAVNLSARHFRLADIVATIRKSLDRSGLDPRRLEIEITERLLMEDPDSVTVKLQEIRALGVTIAMDDFGTGYSSLSYLMKFPFDKIKIDKSFIDASSEDSVARDILRAIASLGKTLRVTITAEGVETAEQAAFLSEIACHQLQGFFFARPLDIIDMPHYLLTQAGLQGNGYDDEPEKLPRRSA